MQSNSFGPCKSKKPYNIVPFTAVVEECNNIEIEKYNLIRRFYELIVVKNRRDFRQLSAIAAGFLSTLWFSREIGVLGFCHSKFEITESKPDNHRALSQKVVP
jgi:hypothetical protein